MTSNLNPAGLVTSPDTDKFADGPRSICTSDVLTMNADPATSPPAFRDLVTNAIRYWEPRRLAYNGLLSSPSSQRTSSPLFRNRGRWSRSMRRWALFILAVLANLCYCGAYLVDLFAQYSAYRSTWLRHRWILLAIGTFLALILAHFISMGLVFSRNAVLTRNAKSSARGRESMPYERATAETSDAISAVLASA